MSVNIGKCERNPLGVQLCDILLLAGNNFNYQMYEEVHTSNFKLKAHGESINSRNENYQGQLGKKL